MLNELTLGSDPEGFLVDIKTKKYVSSEGLLGGSKAAPRPLLAGAVLEDNVTAEFNTPVVRFDDGEAAFVDSIVSVREGLRRLVADRGLDLEFSSCAKFNPTDLCTEQARESGCDPDYNVYTGDRNSYPSMAGSPVRYCGGHVHIGHPLILDNPRFLPLIIKFLDCSVTAAMTVLDGITDRHKVYGKLGNFRPKPYGLEYRSPSNAWVKSPDRISFVREMVGSALYEARDGRDHQSRVNRISLHIQAGDPKGVLKHMHPIAYEYGAKRGWW